MSKLKSTLICIKFACAAALPMAACANSEDDKSQAKAETAEISSEAKLILQRYGWSIPLCEWQYSRRIRCTNVSRLLKTYPFEKQLIIDSIATAIQMELNRKGVALSNPEDLLAELLRDGVPAGCVEMEGAASLVSLGVEPPENSNGDFDVKEICQSNQNKSLFSGGLSLSQLTVASRGKPLVSLSADGQATYEGYLAECQANNQFGQNPISTVAAGDAVDARQLEEKRKKAEEARKKAVQAKKKAAEEKKNAEAAAEKQRAKQKAVQDKLQKSRDARQRQQRVNQNPNSSQAARDNAAADVEAADADFNDAVDDLAEATNDATRANNEAADAAAAADQAEVDADQASRDYVTKLRDMDTQGVVNDLVSDYLTGGGPFNDTNIGVSTIRLLSGYAGVLSGRHGGGGDCIYASSCGYNSCEEEARGRALNDEIAQYKIQGLGGCNPRTTPKPGENKCYETNHGPVALPQVTIKEGWKWHCKLMERVSDIDCSKKFREVTRTDFDPCIGPLVMCAPDASMTGTQNQSMPLPPKFHGPDPNIWNPESD